MSPAPWFRSASAALVIFAAGHTYGFLGFTPPTLQAQAVWSSMEGVRFKAGSATFSYGDFYVGFGLFITAFFMFEALVAWCVADMARRGIREARHLAIGMILLQMVGLGLSWRYFSMGPVILSAVVALLVLLGLVSMWRSARVGGSRGA